MRNDFQELIWQKGHELYREMPWRQDTRPYFVLVSELMLQQTQVARVIPKFEAFIATFSNVESLARASLSDILRQWQGLGYNRRAKYLQESAKLIVTGFGGEFPETEADLLRLPGVGKNTAGAIRAYSFNQPAIFIETNIRTVYIHHFFAEEASVNDSQIQQKLLETIDYEHPREFYQALMDYGTWLKANGVQNSKRSHHYKKQSPLKGSVREVRGQIVAQLVHGKMILSELEKALETNDRFAPALNGLVADGLVGVSGDTVHLTK